MDCTSSRSSLMGLSAKLRVTYNMSGVLCRSTSVLCAGWDRLNPWYFSLLDIKTTCPGRKINTDASGTDALQHRSRGRHWTGRVPRPSATPVKPPRIGGGVWTKNQSNRHNQPTHPNQLTRMRVRTRALQHRSRGRPWTDSVSGSHHFRKRCHQIHRPFFGLRGIRGFRDCFDQFTADHDPIHILRDHRGLVRA